MSLQRFVENRVENTACFDHPTDSLVSLRKMKKKIGQTGTLIEVGVGVAEKSLENSEKLAITRIVCAQSLHRRVQGRLFYLKCKGTSWGGGDKKKEKGIMSEAAKG